MNLQNEWKHVTIIINELPENFSLKATHLDQTQVC